MMLPTDMALQSDPHFSPYVKQYAEHQELFFRDFATVFAKLLELGIQRDEDGRITNADNEKGGYHSAPKKKAGPGMPEKTSDDRVDVEEARPLAEQSRRFRAKL